MKTSSPRTFSSIFTNVSPSGNGLIVELPSSIPMEAQIALHNGSLDVPLKIFTLFVSDNLKVRRIDGRRKSSADFTIRKPTGKAKEFRRKISGRVAGRIAILPLERS